MRGNYQGITNHLRSIDRIVMMVLKKGSDKKLILGGFFYFLYFYFFGCAKTFHCYASIFIFLPCTKSRGKKKKGGDETIKSTNDYENHYL